MKVLCFIKNKDIFLVILMILYQEIFELYKIHTFAIFICFQAKLIENKAKEILYIDLGIHQKRNMNPWVLFTKMLSHRT